MGMEFIGLKIKSLKQEFLILIIELNRDEILKISNIKLNTSEIKKKKKHCLNHNIILFFYKKKLDNLKW